MSVADANARLNQLIVQLGDLAGGAPPVAAAVPATSRPNPNTNNRATQTTDFPTDIQLPVGCVDIPNNIPNIRFDLTTPYPPPADPPTSGNLNLRKMVELNSTESGGEVYTKSSVYVAYVNILRYTASLSGVVSTIGAPSIPLSQMFTTTPLSPSAQTQAKNEANKGEQPQGAPLAPPPPQQPPPIFGQFKACYDEVEGRFIAFQTKLQAEEGTLSQKKKFIADILTGLQPFAGSVDAAREPAKSNWRQLPQVEIPDFPRQDLAQLKILISDFIAQYNKTSTWASAQQGEILADYNRVSTGATAISTRLDQYLGSASTANTDSTTNAATSSKKADAKKETASAPVANSQAGAAATEADDFQATADFVRRWRKQFYTVVSASPDAFVAPYKPACGGFFGDGTSTLIKLSLVDNLNPPAAGAQVTPTNLDSVVCQPTISISQGLGLSFIPSQTPAFVPAVKKDAQGNPVLDSSGNPVIVQSLGYSNQSHVSAGYALQTNASLWATQQWGFEIHWSVGAMLTASTSGTTTDIVTGPSFSFRRRTFFVSPMYDLGLRTIYVSPFQVGMPQGNLTSPPTQQIWKSGFGVTITFPLNAGTKNTTSTGGNGGATVSNGANNADTTKKKPSDGTN